MKRIALRAPRGARDLICQFCEFSTSSRRLAMRSQPALVAPHAPRASRNADTITGHSSNLTLPRASLHRFASSSAVLKSQDDPDLMLREVLKDSHVMITGTTLPDEETIVRLLERCKSITNIALSDNNAAAQTAQDNATSSLLDLENENGSSNKPAPKRTVQKNFRQRATIGISSMLNELLRDPKVFITPKILHEYTVIQSQLKKGDHFPEIFSLYATNPHRKSADHNHKLADMALEVAIEQKNLSLALAIVDTTFCTPAFRRAKVLQRASLPIAGLIGTPPAAYMAASYASTFQNTMNPTTSTWIAFSAILAYITFTSSVGLVAIATANDQMQRVVWIPGMPLRQRWLREEERAAMDRIAVAWGFKDPWMHGEEEGEEWDNLREFLGMRGMVLDKTDLMEGME
ncbi:hypothetical protein CISG_07402 [Coccidioides immitis RMSCC 3703]|uniref:Uncharacterized protein n=1 Tax=Coccidioides immitis RMSCC 3703 TaxID=454286 RepID=A0A0J8R3D9_COCIT|nr:hypothetical protein CISG_07402 [Coccidioides immitis RMSCC 3703]